MLLFGYGARTVNNYGTWLRRPCAACIPQEAYIRRQPSINIHSPHRQRPIRLPSKFCESDQSESPNMAQEDHSGTDDGSQMTRSTKMRLVKMPSKAYRYFRKIKVKKKRKKTKTKMRKIQVHGGLLQKAAFPWSSMSYFS
jgi:hypothetical protein